MKIATFNTQQAAENKLEDYNTMANYKLVNIFKHTTEEKWWFNFSDCIKNGGSGATDIAADEPTLNILEFDNYQALIDNGYLPEPGPE